MARLETLTVTLPGGRRAVAHFRGHTVVTDQSLDNGGEDTAAMPLEIFFASMGACVGVTVQGFCAKRNIPTAGITVDQHMHYTEDGTIERVTFDVHLPADFPEKYREAVLRAAETCSVKRAIAAQPKFEVRAADVSAAA